MSDELLRNPTHNGHLLVGALKRHKKKPVLFLLDPNPMFVGGALGLLEKVDSLKQILTIGPVPEALNGVAVDLSAEAAKHEPKPLVVADLPPDHIGGLTYT